MNLEKQPNIDSRTLIPSPLKALVKEAIVSLHQEMGEIAPFMAGEVNKWTKHLAQTPNPEDYYLHPKAFPMLLLPWWMEQTFHSSPAVPFQTAVAASSINGYYYTRLVDNIMDGDGDVEISLLPSAHFFLCKSQLAYYPYFSADHPFWHDFLTTLVMAGETAMRDAETADIDLATFTEVSAQKVCGAKIPLAAVAYHYNQTDLIAPWSQFVDLFGSWHQMTDDLFDWHKDLQLENPTYFLSEARRQSGKNDVASWVIDQGFEWGCQQLALWLDNLHKMAQPLQSPSLTAYLKLRGQLLQEQKADARTGLKGLAKLLKIIG
jgi:hypothetical protein